jgi:endonuclease III
LFAKTETSFEFAQSMKRAASKTRAKKSKSKNAPSASVTKAGGPSVASTPRHAAKSAAPNATSLPAGANPRRVRAILEKLDEAYPDATCELKHGNAFQLLIATILSAQSTDVGVNMVTPALFKAYPTPAALAYANPSDVEVAIHSTGFFRAKTRSIQGASKKIVEEFGGEVPRTMEQLLTLPGVARKTANVVLGVAFGIATGVVVDTHVLRLSERLDLTHHTEPKKVEQDLIRILPQEKWIVFSHQLIWHGRRVCVARKPRCIECNLERLCYARDKTI